MVHPGNTSTPPKDTSTQDYCSCYDHPVSFPSNEFFSAANAIFRIMPKINGRFDTAHNTDWTALLIVKANDICRLMREGFHWTEDNVVKEKGQLVSNYFDNHLRDLGCSSARFYYLLDRAEEPQWSAKLFVSPGPRASAKKVLSCFRVSDLSPDLIYAASGLNEVGAVIYYYDALLPGEINTVYDDMPLAGFWPWPKKEPEKSRIQAQGQDEGEDWVYH